MSFFGNILKIAAPVVGGIFGGPLGAAAGQLVGGLVGGAASSAVGGNPQQASQQAAAASDPFAGQRGQYQTALSSLMQGGASSFANDPSYQFRLQQGSTNLARQMAAQHLTASGQELAALQDYGQNTASTEYQNQYQRLAQLAGANIGSPAAAGQILYNQGQQTQQAASSFGNMIGGAVTTGLNGLTSSWGSQPPAPTYSDPSSYAPSYGNQAGGYNTSFGGFF